MIIHVHMNYKSSFCSKSSGMSKSHWFLSSLHIIGTGQSSTFSHLFGKHLLLGSSHACNSTFSHACNGNEHQDSPLKRNDQRLTHPEKLAPKITTRQKISTDLPNKGTRRWFTKLLNADIKTSVCLIYARSREGGMGGRQISYIIVESLLMLP